MSLLHKRDYFGISNPSELIPPRSSTTRAGTVNVTADSALRHSAVWACLRLRANLLSTMPVDAFRKVDDVQVEIPKPPVLVYPGGTNVSIHEWLYSSQFDLDRCGNSFGIITERSGFGSGTGQGDGLPARIDLVAPGEVAIVVKKGKVDHYRIGGAVYQPSEVWHEKQYTVAGLHVGLSPVAYGAWSIGEYLSIQDFALGWFGGGGIPSAILTNKGKPTLAPDEAATIKERFKAAVAGRDLFVTGGDWEYHMVQAEQAGANWIEAKQYGIGDIARFFDVPGDLIDAAVTGVNLTYANAVQRNLQFLVMHLGPAVFRREQALSRLLPQPRYVKLNAGALLRMDPASKAAMLQVLIASRQLAPSEARALDDRAPFTEPQMAEFDRFWPPKAEPKSNQQVPAGVST